MSRRPARYRNPNLVDISSANVFVGGRLTSTLNTRQFGHTARTTEANHNTPYISAMDSAPGRRGRPAAGAMKFITVYSPCPTRSGHKYPSRRPSLLCLKRVRWGNSPVRPTRPAEPLALRRSQTWSGRRSVARVDLLSDYSRDAYLLFVPSRLRVGDFYLLPSADRWRPKLRVSLCRLSVNALVCLIYVWLRRVFRKRRRLVLSQKRKLNCNGLVWLFCFQCTWKPWVN